MDDRDGVEAAARVLIVEDERLVAEYIVQSLKDLGYEVVGIVSTGEESVRIARASKPDLILMDIELAGAMDGIDAANEIRSHVDTCLVFLTAHADEDLLVRARKTGPHGYLVKPSSTSQLRSTLEMALSRHETDARLRESEARYRAVVEDQTELICRFLPDLTLTFVNTAYCRYFGEEAEELVGRSFLSPISDAFRDQVRDHFASFTPEDPTSTQEHQVIAADGRIAWQEWTNRALYDDQGRLIEFQAVGRDVTRRKKAEEALPDSNEKLDGIISALSDHISIIDEQHNIVWANDTAECFFGTDLVGRKCYSAYHSREAVCESCVVSKVFADGNLHEHEVDVIASDGTIMTFWCTATVVSRHEDGRPKLALEISRNVTERKRVGEALKQAHDELEQVVEERTAELWRSNERLTREIFERKRREVALRESAKRFQQVAENAQEWIWEVDADGLYTYSSPTVERILGYDPEEVVGKKHFFDLFHPDDREELKQKAFEVFAGREFFREFINRNVHKDGTTVWLSTSGIPLFSDKGVLLGYRGADANITERKKAEDALQQSRQILAVRDRIAQVFLTVPDDEVYGKVLEVALEAMKSPYGVFGYIEEDGSLVCPSMTRGIRGQRRAPERVIVYPRERWGGIWGRTLIGKTTQCSNEPGNVPELHIPITRSLVVPIVHRDKALGLLHVANKEADYDEKDRSLLESIADYVAYILHARLSREREERVRKRAEEALRRNEERYRRLVETMNEGVVVLDGEALISYVNDKLCQMLEYSRNELVGRSSFDLVKTGHRELFKKQLKALPNGEFCSYETVLVSRDGRSIHVIVSASPLPDQEGVENGSFAVFTDITDMKKAEEDVRRKEEFLRTVFEAAHDCIFIKDRSLRYTHVNPAMERLFGKQSPHFIGKTDQDLYGRDSGRYLEKMDRRVLQGAPVEHEHTRPVNGVPTTFLETRAPIRTTSGEIVGLCGFARDITERKTSAKIVAPRAPRNGLRSNAGQALMAAVNVAAMSDGVVLLLGETGSGKDYVANLIHQNSRRADGPFLSVNCAAVAEGLAESELFGHEPGAFTGAGRLKRGLLELSEGGTLLLNEIGELSLQLQAKLLSFLDSRSFYRVGGNREIFVDARLIAATNRDLTEEIAQKRFREDLFYRLNVLCIRVPALRERLDDLGTICGDLLAQLAAELGLTKVPELDGRALETLKSYHWPGNVRELRNVLERGLMVEPHARRLSLHRHLAGGLAASNSIHKKWSFSVDFPEDGSLSNVVTEVKRSLITEALRRCDGRKSDAARLLGMSRQAFLRLRKSVGLTDRLPSTELEE